MSPDAFWRSSVATVAATEIEGLWSPKWPIDECTRIATAGSCFAQNFGAALKARGFAWVEAEPAPAPLPPELARSHGYGLFSSRTGNVYTSRQLRQWLDWASDPTRMPTETWAMEGRWFDPFRPRVEPDGFRSHDELLASRLTVLRCLREAIETADMFVFTLGLTECWRNSETGSEYPTCPGTVAGRFDPERHHFHNQGYTEILADMEAAIRLLRSLQPDIRIMLTVSPVSLTATASGHHVLVANSHSKSLLRSVAGELAGTLAYCDYFPSYEMVTAPAFRGMFYSPNIRTVTKSGVDFVMRRFFDALDRPGKDIGRPTLASDTADPLCDEAMLDNFSRA